MLCFSQMIGTLPRHKLYHPSSKQFVTCLTQYNLFFVTSGNDSAKMFYWEIKIKESDSSEFLIPSLPPQKIILGCIKMYHNLCFECRFKKIFFLIFKERGREGERR